MTKNPDKTPVISVTVYMPKAVPSHIRGFTQQRKQTSLKKSSQNTKQISKQAITICPRLGEVNIQSCYKTLTKIFNFQQEICDMQKN